jgi:hydrogenase nickel incorporation protein HypA/HybF
MHELSIASSVVESLTQTLCNEPGQVISVQLRIGALSGVVPDALQFAWDLACENTRLEGSKLVIQHVPAKIWCNSCQSEAILPVVNQMLCPRCGKPTVRIVAGRELEIHSVEVTENVKTD